MTPSLTTLRSFSRAVTTTMTTKPSAETPVLVGNIERGRESAALRFHNDYFAPTPTYTAQHFQRRFRISRSVFDRIVGEIPTCDIYFVRREDFTKRKGFTCHQKVTAALRLLVHGTAADPVDDYIWMAEPNRVGVFKAACQGCD